MTGDHRLVMACIVVVFIVLFIVAWKHDPEKTAPRPRVQLPTYTYKSTTTTTKKYEKD